ncbi:FecCD family ABC transporter permease [Metabacillus iocasae]|uniref:Iron complex transport system permease protein n=1 Tax=Priestia iocasae TaxID=2291674 RepID=A0ABS2QYI8_9BACI|nr:iron ABC transporter permease [Metabacillus iocasae]MBM7704559.1 iron complex transport system permease protein [Metabacillus iocasae]
MVLRTFNLKLVGLMIGSIILIICIGLSIILGYTNTSIETSMAAFRAFDGSNEHLIIQNVRLPRALIGAVVGSSLGIAGAMMQALTKNPLASPDIIGVNAGASFFIVVAVMIFSITSLQAFTWIAFLGATITVVVVYFLGSLGREGLTPIKLTLAGAAIAALFSSLTQGLLVLDESSLDQVLYWLAGSVQGRKLDILYSVLPYIVVATVGAFLLANKINILTIGEDVAKGLGQRTGMVKIGAGIVIVFLAGGAVAIAGPISFVGIIVPHIVRWLVGQDYRWIFPYCGVLGGILLLIADISARYVIMPEEIPVGIMTACIGTPFFIYIARKGVRSS